ncbi:Restriction endonuclease [Frankia sp. AiPs1]
MNTGVRLIKWSAVRDELEAALIASGAGNNLPAPEYPVVALRHSPLWEIRASSTVPPADGSLPRRWLDDEDPELGLSDPAFDLLTDESSRSRFIAALHSMISGANLPVSNSAPDSYWIIDLGIELRRGSVHDKYGGSRQSGISPSARTPNILLFTDPVRGRSHGYFDGWGDDGAFHYTGTGKTGDQKMSGDNEAVARYRATGRQLRLFRVTRKGWVRYIGCFGLDPVRPWYTSRAPSTGGGPLRSVIVFRLQPEAEVDYGEFALPGSADMLSRVVSIPLEKVHADEYFISRSTAAKAERREGLLVHEYADYLRSLGHNVDRLQILPPGVAGPLLTDLYDETAGDLIEAKSVTSRDAIRLAVGQLFDYRRFIDPLPRLNILVPSRPHADLLDFCASVNVRVIWKAKRPEIWAHS